MIAVGKKGSYRWNSDGTLLIMLPKTNFMWQTKRCWMDSEVHERIGVDLNLYSVRVVCEGDHPSDDPWYLQHAITFAGGDVMLHIDDEEKIFIADVPTKGEKIMLSFIVLLTIIIVVKMFGWMVGSLV